jgi:hypothetical protein
MLGGGPLHERDDMMPMGNDELIEEADVDLGSDDEGGDDDLEGM